MELAFASSDLRTICEQQYIAKDVLGKDVAETLKHRLADLRAAASIHDLLAGTPRTFNDGNANHLVIVLSPAVEIVLVPNHPKNPLCSTPRIDWTTVNRLKVTEIRGEHASSPAFST